MQQSSFHQKFLSSHGSMVCLPKPIHTKNGIPYWDFGVTNGESSTPTANHKNDKESSKVAGKKKINSNLFRRQREQRKANQVKSIKNLILKSKLRVNGHVSAVLDKRINGHNRKVGLNGIRRKVVEHNNVSRVRNGINGQKCNRQNNLNGKKTDGNQKIHVNLGNKNGYIHAGTSKPNKSLKTSNNEEDDGVKYKLSKNYKQFLEAQERNTKVRFSSGKNVVSSDEYENCPHCPVRFKASWRLKEHMWIHTGVKAFPCEICDMKYVLVQSLTRHYANQHLIDLTYKCQHCQRKMKHEEIYLNHMKIFHRNVSNSKKMKT